MEDMDEESESLWQDFLNSLYETSETPVSANKDVSDSGNNGKTLSLFEDDDDDDANDPEYNVFKDLEDLDFDEDFNFFSEGSDYVTGYFDKEEEANLSDISTPKSSSIQTNQALNGANLFTKDTVEILYNQLRFHVQALTQTCILSFKHDELSFIGSQAKQMLLEFDELYEKHKTDHDSTDSELRSKSIFNIPNLKPSISLINEKEKEITAAERGCVFQLISFFTRKLVSTRRDIFIFDWAFPSKSFMSSDKSAIPFSLAEDHLIALGLKDFSKSRNFNKELYKNIHEHYLPVRKDSKIRDHIKNLKRNFTNYSLDDCQQINLDDKDEKFLNWWSNPIIVFFRENKFSTISSSTSKSANNVVEDVAFIYRKYRNPPKWFTNMICDKDIESNQLLIDEDENIVKVNKRPRYLAPKGGRIFHTITPTTGPIYYPSIVSNQPIVNYAYAINYDEQVKKKYGLSDFVRYASRRPKRKLRSSATNIMSSSINNKTAVKSNNNSADGDIVDLSIPVKKALDLKVQEENQVNETEAACEDNQNDYSESTAEQQQQSFGDNITTAELNCVGEKGATSKDIEESDNGDNETDVLIINDEETDVQESKLEPDDMIDQNDAVDAEVDADCDRGHEEQNADKVNLVTVTNGDEIERSSNIEDAAEEEDIVTSVDVYNDEEEEDEEEGDVEDLGEDETDLVSSDKIDEFVEEEDDCKYNLIDNENDLMALMEASWTAVTNRVRNSALANEAGGENSSISANYVKRKSEIIARQQSSSVFILKKEIDLFDDDENEEHRKDLLIHYYLKRAQKILTHEDYVHFLEMLVTFLDKQTTNSNNTGTLQNDSTSFQKLHLNSDRTLLVYSQIKQFLVSLRASYVQNESSLAANNKSRLAEGIQELIELAVLFLDFFQAQACGEALNYLCWKRVFNFVQKVEIYLSFIYSNRSQEHGCIQRLIRSLNQLSQQSSNNSNDPLQSVSNKKKIKAVVSKILNGHTLLMAEFSSLFNDDPPSRHLYANHGDFDEFVLDGVNQQVEMFDPESVNVPINDVDLKYGTNECSCKCHSEPSNKLSQITNHCASCGIRFISGRIYLPHLNSNTKKLQLVEYVRHNSSCEPIETGDESKPSVNNLIHSQQCSSAESPKPNQTTIEKGQINQWTIAEDRMLLEECRSLILGSNLTQLTGQVFDNVAKRLAEGHFREKRTMSELSERLRQLIEMLMQ